jgi:hypothetical protein
LIENCGRCGDRDRQAEPRNEEPLRRAVGVLKKGEATWPRK